MDTYITIIELKFKKKLIIVMTDSMIVALNDKYNNYELRKPNLYLLRINIQKS